MVGHQILTPGKPSGADMGQLTPLYGAAVVIDGARRGVDLAAVYGGTQPSMDSWEPFAIAYAGVLHFQEKPSLTPRQVKRIRETEYKNWA